MLRMLGVLATVGLVLSGHTAGDEGSSTASRPADIEPQEINEAAAPEQPNRENCPPGFTWVRMSGTGCVQETLPSNGKIGYDGHALCVEPYVGIYEQRPTTDGKPAPGSPYTSFSYLLRCVTPDQYDRAVADLADKQGGPSLVRTGAAGLAVTGGLVALGGAAVLVNRRRSSAAHDKAARDRRRQRQQQLKTRLGDLSKQQADLDQLAERIRNYLNDDGSGIQSVNELVGLISSFVGLHPSAATAGGIVSLLSTGGGQAQGAWSTDEVRDQMRDLLESVELMRGAVEAETEAINRDLAALAQETEPDRLSAESFTDYDTVQERIDSVNEEISQISATRNGHELARAELQTQLNDVDNKVDQLRDQLFNLEFGEITHDAIGKGGAASSILLGILALGPGAPAAIGIAGVVGSVASFAEWMRSASVEETKKAIAFGLQGYQHSRGRLMYQMQDAADQQAAAQTKLDGALEYKSRLRQHQAGITKNTGRGVLWPKQ